MPEGEAPLKHHPSEAALVNLKLSSLPKIEIGCLESV